MVRPCILGPGGGGDGDGDDDAPLLLNSAGAAEANLGTRVGDLTARYTGCRVHLNRVRQILETHSMDHFAPGEQEAVSRAQAHSSKTAKRHYQKKRARDAAMQSRAAFEGSLGTAEAIGRGAGAGPPAPAPKRASKAGSSTSARFMP